MALPVNDHATTSFLQMHTYAQSTESSPQDNKCRDMYGIGVCCEFVRQLTHDSWNLLLVMPCVSRAMDLCAHVSCSITSYINLCSHCNHHLTTRSNPCARKCDQPSARTQHSKLSVLKYPMEYFQVHCLLVDDQEAYVAVY